MPWEQRGPDFVDATRSLHRLGDESTRGFLFAVTPRLLVTGDEASRPLPASVQRVFPSFCKQLLDALPAELIVHDIPRALEVLALLHEDAPPEVVGLAQLQLDDVAGDERMPVNVGPPVPLYRKTAAMLANLVGDGVGERATLLQRLLDRLRRHGQRRQLRCCIGGLTMRALGNAA